MKKIIFAFPSYENLAQELAKKNNLELGSLVLHRFPEGESYVKINSDVKNKKVILLCGLENADEKIMALIFFAKTVKEFGALEIGLIAPYLGYMRMDKRFNEGEAITSNIFAAFLSKQVDWLVTIDPHLHRHKTLEEIYTIKCQTLHATKPIAAWVVANVKNPLLIGPDEESLQWVSSIAKECNAPYIVLNKVRRGDRDVEVSIPDLEKYKNKTPILVDDIIATANTMIEAVKHLNIAKNKGIISELPICIGVHAIFAGNALQELQNANVQKIITCNTIKHQTNVIDLSDLIASAIANF